MLGGEGADELLAGYGNNIRAYRQQRLAAVVPRSLRRLAASLARPTPARRVFARAAQSDTEFITAAFRLANHATLAGASRMALPEAVADDEALLAEIGFDARRGTFLDRLLYFQFKTYLIALLMKQDKMSMAASIETRVPFLDHGLVEYAFRLPAEQKIRGQVGKRLLRDVSTQLLPQDVITRPKQGFPVPIAQWFRQPGNPFIDTLLDEHSTRDGLIEPKQVRASVAAFQAGANNSLELWALLNLELWRRKFMG
jgi:asparagine synthase (glutamine-hydrolysing)